MDRRHFGYSDHDITRTRSPAYSVGHRLRSVQRSTTHSSNAYGNGGSSQQTRQRIRGDTPIPSRYPGRGYNLQGSRATAPNRAPSHGYDMHGNRLTTTIRKPTPGYSSHANLKSELERSRAPNGEYNLHGSRTTSQSRTPALKSALKREPTSNGLEYNLHGSRTTSQSRTSGRVSRASSPNRAPARGSRASSQNRGYGLHGNRMGGLAAPAKIPGAIGIEIPQERRVSSVSVESVKEITKIQYADE